MIAAVKDLFIFIANGIVGMFTAAISAVIGFAIIVIVGTLVLAPIMWAFRVVWG